VKGRALAVAAAGFVAGAVVGARLGNRAWRATLTAARYRARTDAELAGAEAQLDLAAATIDGLRAELARQRREYAALASNGEELIGQLRRGQELIAELRDKNEVAFDVGLGVGRSASVAELLGGRWTRN
jgi:hypothetical protein